MTKRILLLAVASIIAVSSKQMLADVPNFPETNAPKIAAPSSEKNGATAIDEYAGTLYRQIDFSGSERLNADVFKKALTGYLNLKSADKLGNRSNILTVCDFSLPSSNKRMWILDLQSKKVLLNDLVAHGQGSGDMMATAFSNTNNSHQSSLGFYVTGDTYTGEHGTSLRLHGQDRGYNDAAFDRGIVVHGAAYVNNAYAAANQRIGRSWGCPAVNDQISQKVINYIKGGSCLFIYANQKQYLQSAYWVNKKVDRLPGSDLRTPAAVPANTQIAAAPGKADSAIAVPTLPVSLF
ncbi:MAG: murein L,D-transpeptidase catalytic domain family protein [Sphingobacteriales bacterium]|nr:MAG: murein L,D-transpeptidase catalytic domain family protein [Sphingobacteriales bacterium]